MVGAFIMQGSEEMYRFDIKEISKEAALKMIQKYHYSNTLPKINKHFLGSFWIQNLLVWLHLDGAQDHDTPYREFFRVWIQKIIWRLDECV